MSSSQSYVNALRQSNYPKLLTYMSFIQKNSEIKGAIGADELMKLIIKGLLETNLNKNDINYLINFQNQDYGNSLAGYNLNTIRTWFAYIIACSEEQRNQLKEKYGLEMKVEAAKEIFQQLDDAYKPIKQSDEAIKLSLVPTGKPSEFVDFERELNKPIYEQALKFKKKFPSIPINSINDYIALKLCEKVKTIVDKLYNDLLWKLENKSFIIDENEELVDILGKEKRTGKTQKLVNRFEVIKSIKYELKDKVMLDEENINHIKGAVAMCKSNKPDWKERHWLQQLLDCLTLGCSVLYRYFTSNERKLENKLEDCCKQSLS